MFSDLAIWKNKGQRAPHKPLLVLIALGRLLQGETRLVYAEVEPLLKELLIEFGPPRKSYHPEYPFVYLTSDGIWELDGDKEIVPGKTYSSSFLSKNNFFGGFTQDILDQYLGKPEAIFQEATDLLEAHFPDTLHEDILQTIGFNLSLDLAVRIRKRTRDPLFRQIILEAYGYRCAVCGYDLRVGHAPVGVEAAHVKWHAAGGPDIAQNGVALCALHHKLFDFGAFSINSNWELNISPSVNGSKIEEYLGRYHGENLLLPRATNLYPKANFVEWHVREVFKTGYT